MRMRRPVWFGVVLLCAVVPCGLLGMGWCGVGGFC